MKVNHHQPRLSCYDEAREINTIFKENRSPSDGLLAAIIQEIVATPLETQVANASALAAKERSIMDSQRLQIKELEKNLAKAKNGV